jgi:glycosyltransferase involved in cell wall biosynthesis
MNQIKGLPFVSVCTPTFNRRPFIPTLFEMFKNQTYPKQNIEWIIVDDGTDKIEDLIVSSGISQIRYFTLPEKITLGKKRNFSHDQCRGDIIVYMDDDDYTPPERISHAVETLLKNSEALCCGASEIYTYFHNQKKMIQFGPYDQNHATAGTFAFRKQLLNITRYNDDQAIAEEREFLKGYTIPFAQLDPRKTILVFSHEHNTFDKRKMLKNNPHPQYVKESNKIVEDFIRQPFEHGIKKFFLEDIHTLLAKYEPGLPIMKPDVLSQIKEIEEERKREQNPLSQILQHKEGEAPRPLSPQEVVSLIQQQQSTIQELQRVIQYLQEGKVVLMRDDETDCISLDHEQVMDLYNASEQSKKQLLEKDVIIQNLQKQLLKEKMAKKNVAPIAVAKTLKNKSDPEVAVSLF